MTNIKKVKTVYTYFGLTSGEWNVVAVFATLGWIAFLVVDGVVGVYEIKRLLGLL